VQNRNAVFWVDPPDFHEYLRIPVRVAQGAVYPDIFGLPERGFLGNFDAVTRLAVSQVASCLRILLQVIVPFRLLDTKQQLRGQLCHYTG
jgi:hypothetical protein